MLPTDFPTWALQRVLKCLFPFLVFTAGRECLVYDKQSYKAFHLSTSDAPMHYSHSKNVYNMCPDNTPPPTLLLLLLSREMILYRSLGLNWRQIIFLDRFIFCDYFNITLFTTTTAVNLCWPRNRLNTLPIL